MVLPEGGGSIIQHLDLAQVGLQGLPPRGHLLGRRAEKVVQRDDRCRPSAAFGKPTDQGGANVPYAGQQGRHRRAF